MARASSPMQREAATFALALALCLLAARAWADSPKAPVVRAAPLALHTAMEKFEFGDYEAVISLLRPLVERGASELTERVDRLEALRTYGIACVFTNRDAAAEGAFLLLLKADPNMRLDPQLVRPEAVSFFEQIRMRYCEELLANVRKNRPRRHVVLNFLPPAGQFQNHQQLKGSLIGAGELAFLATNVVTGLLLNAWQGDDHTFVNAHENRVSDARVLQPINVLSFALLASVVVYGIVDGLVVGHRLTLEERRTEERLRANAEPRLRWEASGFSWSF